MPVLAADSTREDSRSEKPVSWNSSPGDLSHLQLLVNSEVKVTHELALPSSGRFPKRRDCGNRGYRAHWGILQGWLPVRLSLATSSSRCFLIAKAREERGWRWVLHSQTLRGECHASGWRLGKVLSNCLISPTFFFFF